MTADELLLCVCTDSVTVSKLKFAIFMVFVIDKKIVYPDDTSLAVCLLFSIAYV